MSSYSVSGGSATQAMESWTVEEVVAWATEKFSPEVAECFKGMNLGI